ncbi:MAG: BON domain-containing protein [Streptosporangiaceae bacterium]|jgi:osmotically-inducible protein OsmY
MNETNKTSETNDVGASVTDDLTFDPGIDAAGITVESRVGDVVLSGSVPSYPQYLEAAAVARRVALTLGHSIAVGVEARAKNGDIILTGAVRNGPERAAAEAMIASLTGVCGVTNDIQLRANATPLPPYREAMGQV